VRGRGMEVGVEGEMVFVPQADLGREVVLLDGDAARFLRVQAGDNLAVLVPIVSGVRSWAGMEQRHFAGQEGCWSVASAHFGEVLIGYCGRPLGR